MSTTLPPRISTYAGRLEDCERRLAEIVGGGLPAVAGPARETLLAGGKRLRPLLVYCCAGGENTGAPDAAAAAVELVHMATLVHDDVLDGAELRRSQPTVAHRYGRERAELTGDHLFALAFGELAGAGSPTAVSVLALASLDLSRGEILQGSRARDLTLDADAYMRRVALKTAALFAAACRLGALTGGGGGGGDALAEYGRLIGTAFQIFDDILDLTGDAGTTGKPRGADLRDGTVTLPMILAMADEPALAEVIRQAMDDGDIAGACAALAEHPGLLAARESAVGLVEKARTIARSGEIGEADGEALEEIAAGVVDRYA